MSKEIKEQPKAPEKKMYAEQRGRYILIDGVKSFFFDFPVQCTFEENYAAVSYIKDQLFKVLEDKAKSDKQKAEEESKKEPEVKEEVKK